MSYHYTTCNVAYLYQNRYYGHRVRCESYLRLIKSMLNVNQVHLFVADN